MNEDGQDVGTSSSVPYRVLARKYRPSDFSGLIGQEPMVRTLTNAFQSGRIAQAWMLTGVRGVGKTTTARILARALNYRTSQSNVPAIAMPVLGEHCQAIMEGRHVDVIEMDAASHTGIDDIREIIEQVRYAPVSARYKVYIIDEVHMLSTQAFNGLLKTLEEPPPHVKFIFATTEIRKVPITVLSRCQRFDLRRVDAGVLTTHLAEIGQREGVKVDGEALAMIARAAEGSVRDALSLLDQAIAHGGGTVASDHVRAMLGLADRAGIIDLFETLMRGDVAAALIRYRSQYDGGADPAVLLTDLADFNHLVTRLRFVPSAADDASLTQDERQRGLELSRKLSVRVLARSWQMLVKGIAEVQTSSRPVNAGEMVLIRIAHAAGLPPLDEVLKALDDPARDETAAAQSPAATSAELRVQPGRGSPAGQHAALGVAPGTAPRPQPDAPPPAEAAETVEVAINGLADIAALADRHRAIAFKVLLKRCVRLVAIEPGRLEVALTEDAPRELLGDLTGKLQQWTGRRWMVSLSRQEGSPTLAEEETSRRESVMRDARADPTVAAVLSTFPGARVIDVRIADAVEAERAQSLSPADADDENDQEN